MAHLSEWSTRPLRRMRSQSGNIPWPERPNRRMEHIDRTWPLEVVIKNQIHGLLTAEGMEDIRGFLQSKIGRQQVLDALQACENGLVAQPLFEMIEWLEENIKAIEKQFRTLAEGDRVVALLMTVPGCDDICAWTIRAYTDDIKRFASAKKYALFAGLAPWVQNSNETILLG